MDFVERLKEMNACNDAVEWAAQYDTFQAAWLACERGDWMLWLAGRRVKDRRRIVVATVDCARMVSHFSKDYRVEACLDAAEGWVRGDVSITELRAADAAAYADAAYAAYAADAACAAADTAFYKAAARTATLRRCADIARKHFTAQEVSP